MSSLSYLYLICQCQPYSNWLEKDCRLQQGGSHLVWPAVPGIEDLQSYAASGTWFVAVDLANTFFSIPVRKKDQKEFIFAQNEHQQAFAVLQGYAHSSASRHNTVWRGLEHVDSLCNHTSTHYVNDMLLRQDEEVVERTLEAPGSGREILWRFSDLPLL